jgi:uncharacterized membrane protein
MSIESFTSAAQYLGVFAGYVGVAVCMITLAVVIISIALIPLRALQEKIARARRYDFLEMFDMDGEEIHEVVNKARHAAHDFVTHQYRKDKASRGVRYMSGEEEWLIKEGVIAAIKNLERSMNKRRAQRKNEPYNKSAITKAQLEINRKLVARKEAIAKREKELGIEVHWKLM